METPYAAVEEDTKKRKFEGDGEGVDGASKKGSLTKEELKKLLDPLSKEQLIDLLADAGVHYVSIAREIDEVASKDPAHRKLFVRGLAWETTTATLREAFAEYGDIDEGAVITDKATGKSRGFGFITFRNMDSAYRALREPSKKIDGRMTVCNLASQGSSTPIQSTVSDQSQRKLYVGSLSYDTTSETLLNYFSQYGEIEEGAVAYDKNTNKSRGFAFVTFKTLEGSKKAVADSQKTIDGRQVVVKVAAEGQREKAALQAAVQSPLLQPQMQSYMQAYTSPMASQVAQLAQYRPQVASNPSVGISYGSPAGMTAYTATQQQAYSGTPQYSTTSPVQQQYAMYATQAYQPSGVAATGVNATTQQTSSGTVPMYFTAT